MPESSFTGDAFIRGDGQKHHRLRDHHGADSDLYVVLSQRIGPYQEYTPIHFVISDIMDRILRLENYDKVRSSFTGDAYISTNAFTGDAVIKKTGIEGSFTGDAYVAAGGSFTGDARIQLAFTGDAYIIAPPT